MNKHKSVVKDKIEKSIVTNRSFSYQKGGLTLNFTIPMTQNGLTDYKECLMDAILDINDSLQEISK